MRPIISFIALILISTATIAQVVIEKPQLYKRGSPYERYTTYRVSLNGGLGMPMSSFKEYMAANTLRNYTFSLELVFPKNNLSAGITFGSQSFTNRLPRQVFVYDNGAISAVQTRTFTAYPILLTGSYHLAPVTARLRPYIQAGAGVAFADLTNYLGSIPTGDNGFKLTAQVGAGLRFLFTKESKIGIELGTTYRHLPFKFENENITSASTLNVQAGLFYRWW